MDRKIDNLELIDESLQKPKEDYKKEVQKLEILQNNTEEIHSHEASQIFDQSDITQSCSFSLNERKKSHDSTSICGSQVETLSQTSESSFFLSYTNQNTQNITSNEIIQTEEYKVNKDNSYYFGVAEYFQKLMPEKFIEYTKTKNYLNKNNLSKKRDQNNPNIDNYIDNHMDNYFYFPIVYCPINTFYFNNISNIIYNNNKCKKNRKENIKQEQRNKNKNKKDIGEDKKENENEEVKTEKIKDKPKEEKDELIQEKSINEKRSKYQNYPKMRNNYNNRSKYQDNTYRKTNYNNKNTRNNQNYNNRKYNNNFSNNYYNNYSDKAYNYYYLNESIKEERTRYYYNNYQKRRYQKPYENKFSNYK